MHAHRTGRRRGRLLLLAALTAVLSGCEGSLLQPAGPVSLAERIIFLDTLVIMLLIVVPVIIATLAFAWWFRASNQRARYLPQWAYSGRIELVIWSIPALVIFFLGGIAWISAHDLDPSLPLQSTQPALEIDVVALDWKWLFIYPAEGVATVNQLVVPVGAPLSFRITSGSVMNSFFVPQLGSQIYAMPGMVNRLELLAENPGTFQGLSANYSGAGFSEMRFDVKAVSAEAFQAWVATTKGVGGTLDPAAFGRLARPSKADTPASFGSVSPRLFEAAIQQTVK